MTAPQDLRRTLELVAGGELAVEDAVAQLRPATDLGFARVDHQRASRCGFPEVVFAEGKTSEALERIFGALLESGVDAFATRVDANQAAHLKAVFSSGRYNERGRTFLVCGETSQSSEPMENPGHVAIVTAGASDAPVAEEARETALWMGLDVTMIYDVGVAGPQRLQANLHKFDSADAVVVIAGMEGALPSVVGGHVACPVIAVPTSVGYGANFGGLAALLGMLNSCAANVTVVNIDAGFKGAYVAGLIAHNLAKARMSRD